MNTGVRHPNLGEGHVRRLLEPGATAAVILGASRWRTPDLASGAPFANAAAEIREYLLNDAELALEASRDVLDLFDTPKNQVDQLEQISDFLEGRVAAVRGGAKAVSAVICYYVGHGAFTRVDRRFFLLVQASDPRRDDSGIRGCRRSQIVYGLPCPKPD
jgi:hypothetical protein